MADGPDRVDRPLIRGGPSPMQILHWSFVHDWMLLTLGHSTGHEPMTFASEETDRG